MSEANKRLVRRWADEMWTAGKLEVADEIYRSPYLYQGVERTPEQFKAGIIAWRTALPDLVVRLKDVLAEGDTVVWEWTISGTHRGTLRGAAPTGGRIELSGVHIGRFESGQVIEEREYFDEQELLRQLHQARTSSR